jgi:5-methylcytosine-specific restriction endonuclease McrA
MPRAKVKRKGLAPSTLDKAWSLAVKTRDKFRCRVCLGEGTDAHHIIHRGQNYGMKWDIENGVCLCRKCHDRADTLNGRKEIMKLVNSEYLEHNEADFRLKHDFLKQKGLDEEAFKKLRLKELKEVVNEL